MFPTCMMSTPCMQVEAASPCLHPSLTFHARDKSLSKSSELTSSLISLFLVWNRDTSTYCSTAQRWQYVACAGSTSTFPFHSQLCLA